MLEHLLKQKYKTQVGGNIGIPVFDLDDSNNFDNEILIIECSSYMLADTFKFHPNIMIITNVYPNHLDHHITFDHYLNSKIKCLNNMDINDTVFSLKSLYNIIDKNNCQKIYLNDLKEFKILNNELYYREKVILNNYSNILLGEHNLYNLWFSLKVCELLKVEIREGILNNFCKPKYRFTEAFKDSKVTIYNDSKSTNFYSLIKAIESLKNRYLPIHWIGGGQDRGEDWESLSDVFQYISFAYVYGENKNRIIRVLENKKIPYIKGDTLKEVIDKLEIKENVIILFSPGAPSLDQFNSYIERGDYFDTVIKEKIQKNKDA